MRRWAAVAACALLALAGACTDDEPGPGLPSDSQATDPFVATTASGDVRGFDAGPVRSWRGIPYAEPPVEELRWLPPREPARWEGVREAVEYGPGCLQGPRSATSDLLFAGIDETSEDCLTLNVHRPDNDRADLPVLVWIHGGSFTHGSGRQPIYNSNALVERGVVLVTVNYRLGRLGFFAHPELTQGDARVANFGLLDQVAALRWVQDNAGAFGGDPANVTVFGESAGGVSVNALLTMPEAQGLFARAITQSGLGREQPATWAQALGDGAGVARRLALDDPTAAELRALDGERLMQMPMSILDGDAPIVDDLLTGPVQASFEEGAEVRVPYLVGATDLELPDLLLQRMGVDPEKARDRVLQDDRGAALAAYGSEAELDKHLLSDVVFTEPARRLAQVHADDATTYLYRFAVTPPIFEDAFGGAPHGSEIPYVFDTAETGQFAFEDSGPLADEICDLWVDFAQDGTVEGWPTAETGEIITFTNAGAAVGVDPWRARLDAVEAGYDARTGRSFAVP